MSQTVHSRRSDARSAWALAAVLVAITACGGSARIAEAPREDTRESNAPTETAEPEAVAEEPSATGPTEVVEPAPTSDVRIDHASLPCWTDGRAPSHVAGQYRHPESSFDVRVRTSARANARGQIRARPGEVLRIEVELHHVGEQDVVLSARDAERLAALTVQGLSTSWELPGRPPEGGASLAASTRIAAGATVRSCFELPMDRSPVDAVDPAREPERVYTLGGHVGFLEGTPRRGGYVAYPNVTVLVRYDRFRGPALREPESWGGVLRVELERGAVPVRVAREAGVRIGSGVPLFEQRGAVLQPGEVLMQVPEERSVREAAAVLEARDDVRRVTPLWRGDPGTEGCSGHSPCPAGHVCCYGCGIPGCPYGCYAGRQCPTGIP